MTSSLRFCPGKCDPQILNRTEQFSLKHFYKGDKLHFARLIATHTPIKEIIQNLGFTDHFVEQKKP